MLFRQSRETSRFASLCDKAQQATRRQRAADRHAAEMSRNRTRDDRRDRSHSIRIPVGTIEDGWKGRLEDRRPASNADPYKVAAAIIKTTKEALA